MKPGGPDPCGPAEREDLSVLVVVLLAGTLAGLRDRLAADGFERAADLVADLVEATEDYLAGSSG